MSKRELLIKWADTLTIEQLKSVVIELCEVAIESEIICFHESSQDPYWDGSGESILTE